MVNLIDSGNIILLITGMSLPFIQLGLSYYVSVNVFSFILATLLSTFNLKFTFKKILIVLIGTIPFILKFAEELTFSRGVKQSLIPLRELVCYLSIISIGSTILIRNYSSYRVFKFTFCFILSIFFLILIQLYAISEGKYFGFPIDLFIRNQNTLLNSDIALTFGTRFRPTSYYGEPSYTGFILITVITIMFYVNKKISWLMILLTLLSLLLSGTMTGVLSLLIILSIEILWRDYTRTRHIKLKSIAIPSIAILFVIASFLLSSELNSRIINLLTANDASSNVRFIKPIEIISNFGFYEYFFGVDNFPKLRIDNALFGLFIHYGITFIFPLFSIFFLFPSLIGFVYLFLVSQFNGDIFSFDKSLIISVTLSIIHKSTLSRPPAEEST